MKHPEPYRQPNGVRVVWCPKCDQIVQIDEELTEDGRVCCPSCYEPFEGKDE